MPAPTCARRRIDHAVFLTTRYRQQLIDGFDPVAAAGRAVATSGRAVLVAATTVSIAMLGLYASGISFIGKLGLAAVVAVAISAAGALTLLPALLGLVATHIDRVHLGRTVAEGGGADDGWRRWALAIEAHPWRFLAAGVCVLAVLAIPVLSMRLGHLSDGVDPRSYTDRRAYDLIASAFGPGTDGTLTIVVAAGGTASVPATLATSLQRTLEAVPDVASVSPLRASPDGAVLYATVVPKTGPQAAATDALSSRLEDTTLSKALAKSGTTAYVTGATASALQFRDEVAARLWIILAVVVSTAFLLLLLTFRSLFIPVKVALLNLCSIGAAYGIVVAVFQWGWGRSILGVGENVPIESYVPMMMFAIVFGLSMDYEVFLLSRVKESWNRDHDSAEAVAAGLSSTARVITCAALIMTSVFLAYVGSSNVVVKMLAVGLASSVLVDATVVRLVLVPATMSLLGDANWWLPALLDRRLAHIGAEGPALAPLPAAVEP